MPTRNTPNIVLISTDQHRHDALGCAGNEEILTPEIDRLAEQGTMFERCYATSPMCAPSRASLMTGQHAHQHGLWANGVQLPTHQRLLSRALADTGYDCGLVGKFHLGPAADGRTEERLNDGFRVFEWAHDPTHTSPQNAFQQWLANHHPEVFEQYQATVPHGRFDSEAGNQARGSLFLDTVPPEAHYSTWVGERAEAFIRHDRGDQPFFLVANFFDPHHPFGAPAEYRDLYDAATLSTPVGNVGELADKPNPQVDYSRTSYAGTAPGFQDYTPEEIQELKASYYAMVSLVDAQVGRILQALDEEGLAEDTLVVFTSDHGEMLGDHAMMLKGPPLYDCVVRVPLILRWPGQLPANARMSELVQHPDLTCALLEATGTTAALPAAQGKDLISLARSETSTWRDYVLVSYRDANFPQDPPIHTTALRRGNDKLVLWHGSPSTDREQEGELYDLSSDPDELCNLWNSPEHQGLRLELTELLVDVMVATEDRSQPRQAVW